MNKLEGKRKWNYSKINRLMWIGREIILIWNKENGQTEQIELSDAFTIKVPYVPKAMAVWDYSEHYSRLIYPLLRPGLLNKTVVMLVIPEDLNAVEVKALQEFVHCAGGVKELVIVKQGQLLQNEENGFISITETERAFCFTLIEDGNIKCHRFSDINDNTRETFEKNINDIKAEGMQGAIEIYYNTVERSSIPDNIGRAISFEEIMENIIKLFY